MDDMDEELERFKREIDFPQYVMSLGYEEARGDSSRREKVFKFGNDKISITRQGDGHYVYSGLKDLARDKGTIIDFVMSRQHRSLGQARQVLRRWLSGSGRPSLPRASPLEAADRDFDRRKVQSAWESMVVVTSHRYLEHKRCLPAALFTSPRFAGLIRTDKYQNAVFAHVDDEGICGYEQKNWTFTGFAANGRKGLGLSDCFETDRRLVFTEAWIESLSHATLFPAPDARYASLGGAMSALQEARVHAEILKMPERSQIIAATNNDETGRKYADFIRSAVIAVKRPDLVFTEDLPPVKDWNQHLENLKGSSFPAAG